MDVLNVALIVLNSVLLTLVVVGARLARGEAQKVLSEAKSHADNAADVVNTAHAAHTSLAEQVVALTKTQADMKQTIQLLQVRNNK